jgi:hypothetical protein
MSIRVTRTQEADRTIVRIDGQLRSADVPELAREYQAVEGPTVLELSHLLSVDPAGRQVLKQFTSLGAQVRGASPYIKLLLNAPL